MDLSHSKLKGVLLPKSSHHWLWLCIWWSSPQGCMPSVISVAVKLAWLHPQRGLNIVSASPRTHLLLLCCFKERGALGIEGTNVGTIPEMVVLVNPNGDYMVRVKTQRWGCYRSTGQKKKNKTRKNVNFPTHHVAISYSSSARLALSTRRTSDKAKAETQISKQD